MLGAFVNRNSLRSADAPTDDNHKHALPSFLWPSKRAPYMIRKKHLQVLKWLTKFHSDKESIRFNGKFLSHFRFTDNIVVFLKTTYKAETMLKIQRSGIKKPPRMGYLRRSLNTKNKTKEELDRRRRVAGAAFGPLKSRYDARTSRHAQIKPPSWTTIAQQREERNMCWVTPVMMAMKPWCIIVGSTVTALCAPMLHDVDCTISTNMKIGAIPKAA
ncbi:hypothetical protein KIN20_011352 [Parelaphostrongylus tenuis]|uniref:Uncharacterized protein n=1 Tax=Parelaphostrongylus tenuis TaxID=148309 RepID=A0AAD5M9A0_PARTN|nr:hypothetical protein KIN20_011352 [Parelaphostrongylus tenuis]